MRKLAPRDIADLTQFFTAAPDALHAGTMLAAQTYEPRGSVAYSPTTDRRLAGLVATALTWSRSTWARTKRILDAMRERAKGDEHIAMLRRICDAPSNGYPRVATCTRTVTTFARRAAELARVDEMLRGAYDAARAEGCSPIAVAMRVFDAERRIAVAGVTAHAWEVEREAEALIASGKADRDALERETAELVDPAIAAFYAAKESVGATKRAEREREEKRREELRAELRGVREAKSRARFDAKLRRAS